MSARFCQFLTPPLSAAVRIESTPGRLVSAIYIHKEKISTMLLVFCGTLDICEQPLVITYMLSSAVWGWPAFVVYPISYHGFDWPDL